MVSEEMELNHVLEADGHPAGGDRPGRVPRAVGRPAAGPHRHAGHAHVGRRRGPAVRREAGRAVHRRAPGPDGHRPPAPPRGVPPGRHGHVRRAISPWPTRARWCWSRTRATPGCRPPRPPVHVALVGIEKVLAADRLPAAVPQPPGPQRHRPEADHLHAPDPRRHAPGASCTSSSSTTAGPTC